MLTNFFDRITRASVRWRWVTLTLTLVILAAGAYAFSQLNQELVPPVSFPQTIVVAQWEDAESTEQFLAEVTTPLETRFAAVEGVVNVESTTTSSLAFFIARNEFGLDQARVREDIEAAIADANLPQGVEPEVITFSLADLPVAFVSVSSADLSLAELKALIENEVQPALEALPDISAVSVSGGQELPAEALAAVQDVIADSEAQAAAAAAEAARLEALKSPLSEAIIAGMAVYGVSVQYADDISPSDVRALINNGGRLALQALRLLTPENLRAAQPAALAYLPTDYTETLDADLAAELNTLAEPYGGIGQFTIAETLAARRANLDILTGQPLALGTIADVVDGELAQAELPALELDPADMAEAPAEETPADAVATDTPADDAPATTVAAEPVALPAAWVAAGEAQGIPLETTADLTPELLQGIAQFSPDMLMLLTPEMLLALDADVVAALPVDFVATLPNDLLAQLAANANLPLATVVARAPVALPAEWIAAAEAQGVTLATTADLTPEFVQGIGQFAPQLLQLLTPEMLLALDADVLSALPADYLLTLDPDVQAQLLAQVDAPPAAGVALPDTWLDAAAVQGYDLATADQLSSDLIRGVALFAVDALDDLTPEMLAALPLAAVGALPPAFLANVDAAQLAAWQAAAEAANAPSATAEAVALPESWIAGAAAQGIEIATTADLTPEFVRAIGQLDPAALDELTPAMLAALPPDVLAALPAAYVNTLDADLRAALGFDDLAAAPAVDPAQLPAIFGDIGVQLGVDLATVADLTPDFMRQIGSFGEQANQLLALLAPETLRLLSPEAVALLPMTYLDTLDAEMRTYLDGLALAYGGAGRLALDEAEAAAALAADAPPLTGVWIEPAEDGSASFFQTAAALVDNPFAAPTAAALLNGLDQSPFVTDLRDWIGLLNADVIRFVTDNEPTFAADLLITKAELLPADAITYLLDNFPDAFSAEEADRLAAVAAGNVSVFVPTEAITRENGNPSVVLEIYKESDANTVTAFHDAEDVIERFAAENNLDFTYVFEQASFIEESIAGVSREGALGALFAVLVILVFLSGSINGKYRLSWRATLIVGLSIPASVLFASLLMWLLPLTIGPTVTAWAAGSDNILINSIAKLFPASITLNIMTLSGLTVAIGRVVDDSIVVLENSYRYIQRGERATTAVYRGTKEVAVAIFAATITTMAVFLPLGFVGGLISEFFLPFGLTVTYALAASYIVSITVVPALTVLLIRRENIPDEKETALQRGYTPILEWALNNRLLTMGLAALIFVGSLFLLTRLPNSFIPALGDPTINITVELPNDTDILTTNAQAAGFEVTLRRRVEGLENILTQVGSGGGTQALFGGGGVTQNLAAFTVSVEEGEDIDALTGAVRAVAEEYFGAEFVRVDAQVQAGFGGFQLIVAGDDLATIIDSAPAAQAALAALDADADGTPDLVNVSSNAEAATDGSTIIRIDGRPAVSFSADLQTSDTIGVTTAAIAALQQALPEGLTVSEGFDSQQQTEGFQAMTSAIGISIVLVYLVMALAFRSLVHPFTILFTLPFALVGAAVALFISGSVLGISAMMGLLMLVGVVVTNGIVLLELVQQLREQGQPTYEALVEAGRTRLRPIWMTALTAILALIPLALSSEGGAIIAAELGTAVIGGLTVSTALTLIVIPVVYSLFDDAIMRVTRWQYDRIRHRLGLSGD